MPKQSPKSEQENKRTTSLHVWLLRLAPYELLLIFVVVLASMNVRFWPLEFVASYIPQIFILVAAYLLIFASVVAWAYIVLGKVYLFETIKPVGITTLLVAFLLGSIGLAQSLNLALESAVATKVNQDHENLTIGTFNKYIDSDGFARDSVSISRSKVDVFALQEVTPAEVRYVQDFVKYEYSFMTDCNCSAADTELALVSKYPITNALTMYEHENAAIIRALIEDPEIGAIVVYAVHLHVPYEYESYNLRAEAFDQLATAVANEKIPTFVVGDMNTTIFSPDMQDFSNLATNVKYVSDRAWPRCSWYGIGEAGCARIDHIYIPNNAYLVAMEIGNQQNSDHRSVVAEVFL